jgi:mono/diheme cytochrome c family protein
LPQKVLNFCVKTTFALAVAILLVECHGLDGRGREKAPDLHAPFIQPVSPGRLFWFLKNGNLKEGMPSWSSLPDQQRWQLVTYLQSLQPKPGHPSEGGE